MSRIELLLQIRAALLQPREFVRLLLGRQKHAFFTPSDGCLFNVGKKSPHRVKVAYGKWIKLVVVALSTTDGLPEPYCADSAHPIGQLTSLIIFGLCAPLFSRE